MNRSQQALLLRILIAVVAVSCCAYLGTAKVGSSAASHADERPTVSSHTIKQAKPKLSERPKTSSVTTTTLTAEQVWLSTPAAQCVAKAESGDNYRAAGMEPYGGRWQFSVATFNGIGFTGLPNRASPATQDAAAFKLYSLYGWSQWETASGCGV